MDVLGEISNDDYSTLADILSVNYYDVAMKLIEKRNEYYLEKVIGLVDVDNELYIAAVKKEVDHVIDHNKVRLDFVQIVISILLSYDKETIERMCEGDLGSYIDLDLAVKAIRNNNCELLDLILYVMIVYHDYPDTLSIVRSRTDGIRLSPQIKLVLDEWGDHSLAKVEERMSR